MGEHVHTRLLPALLVLSASAVTGGYAVFLIARGRPPWVQTLSVACMLVPPAAAWVARLVRPITPLVLSVRTAEASLVRPEASAVPRMSAPGARTRRGRATQRAVR